MGLLVVNPGTSATVQDQGRFGYREWGVPVGGAFDGASADLANALLSNPVGCAVLELALFGGTFEARAPLALALAGAPMDARVIARDGLAHPLSLPSSFSLEAGERLVLGRANEGARAYLAVRGGWQTQLVLGSRSREDRLRPGMLLPAQTGSTPARHPADARWVTPTAEPFRVVAGPDGRFGFDHRVWERRSWRVGSRSDRMGIRLEGDGVRVESLPGRVSAPVAPGAVQVAGGQLIVLGVACGTMGGYPHVAHVITADLDRLGQVRPGDELRFRRVTVAEAREADRLARRARADLLRRVATAAGDAG
jgi:biotin-dependent carboxylase-like uncharacterized protein